METESTKQREIIAKFEKFAKGQGMTLEEYLAKNPQDYRLLRALGTVLVGPRAIE
jgi:hypothetical protein